MTEQKFPSHLITLVHTVPDAAGKLVIHRGLDEEPRDASVRLAAAQACGELGSDCGQEHLSALSMRTTDPQAKVRRAAIQALGRIGPAGWAPSYPFVAFGSDDGIRHFAAETLGAAGDEAAAAVCAEQLKTAGPDVKRSALLALGRMKLVAWAPQVAGCLHDSDLATRLAAIQALSDLKAEEHAEELEALAVDGNKGVRQAAVAALAKMGSSGARWATSFLEDEDPAVRQSAAKPYAEMVARRLLDEDWRVRLAAVVALGDLDAQSYVEQLGALKGDPDNQETLSRDGFKTIALAEQTVRDAEAKHTDCIAAWGKHESLCRQQLGSRDLTGLWKSEASYRKSVAKFADAADAAHQKAAGLARQLREEAERFRALTKSVLSDVAACTAASYNTLARTANEASPYRQQAMETRALAALEKLGALPALAAGFLGDDDPTVRLTAWMRMLERQADAMDARVADFLGDLFGSWGFNQAFCRNWLHMNIEDDEMRDIPNPWNEMQLHISYKFAEAFSLLGLGAGLVLARKPNRLRKMGQAAFLGTCIGAGPVGFTAWNWKGSTLKDDEIYDRAYRLRYNRHQIRVDQAFEAAREVLRAAISRGVSSQLAEQYAKVLEDFLQKRDEVEHPVILAQHDQCIVRQTVNGQGRGLFVPSYQTWGVQLWKQRPLAFMQSGISRRSVQVCCACLLPIGSLASQLRHVGLDPPAGAEESPKEGFTPGQVFPCAEGCSEVFCTEACRAWALAESSHAILCRSRMEPSSSSALQSLEQLADEADQEHLLLLAHAVAQMILARKAGASEEQVKHRFAYQFASAPWKTLAENETDAQAREEWFAQAWELLKSIFAFEDLAVEFLDPELLSGLLGTFELVNMCVSIPHPLNLHGPRLRLLGEELAAALVKLQDRESEARWGEDADDAEGEVINGAEALESACTGQLFENVMGTALCEALAFINHSCLPNCRVEFASGSQFEANGPGLWLYCVSRRPLVPGDEVLMAYVPSVVGKPLEVRQQKMKKFGFECNCRSCETDKVLEMEGEWPTVRRPDVHMAVEFMSRVAKSPCSLTACPARPHTRDRSRDSSRSPSPTSTKSASPKATPNLTSEGVSPGSPKAKASPEKSKEKTKDKTEKNKGGKSQGNPGKDKKPGKPTGEEFYSSIPAGTPFAKLGSLKDVAADPEAFPELLVQKLELCMQVYNFQKDDCMPEKEGKRFTLLEILHYWPSIEKEEVSKTRSNKKSPAISADDAVNSSTGPLFSSAGTESSEVSAKALTTPVLAAAVKVVRANAFRSMMHKERTPMDLLDGDDDEPLLEPTWPHLELVYELLMKIISAKDVDYSAAQSAGLARALRH
eukprot:g30253.t2